MIKVHKDHEFKSEEIVLTSTGRTTTPFPKYKNINDMGNIAFCKLFNKISQWMIDNCIEEAASRKDNFNLMKFKGMKNKDMPATDSECCIDYLFNPQWSNFQPDISEYAEKFFDENRIK